MNDGGESVTLRDYFEIQFRDLRTMLDERNQTQQLAMQTALVAADKAVQIALEAANKGVQTAMQTQEKATSKAEVSADERSRATDQRILDLTKITDKRIQDLTDRVNIGAGASAGSSHATQSTWSYIFPAIMVLIGAASVVVLILSS